MKLIFKIVGCLVMILGCLGVAVGFGAEYETPMTKIFFVLGFSFLTIAIGYAIWHLAGGSSSFPDDQRRG